MLEITRSLGFTTYLILKAIMDGRNRSGEELLAVLCHLDVVPAGICLIGKLLHLKRR